MLRALKSALTKKAEVASYGYGELSEYINDIITQNIFKYPFWLEIDCSNGKFEKLFNNYFADIAHIKVPKTLANLDVMFYGFGTWEEMELVCRTCSSHVLHERPFLVEKVAVKRR